MESCSTVTQHEAVLSFVCLGPGIYEFCTVNKSQGSIYSFSYGSRKPQDHTDHVQLSRWSNNPPSKNATSQAYWLAMAWEVAEVKGHISTSEVLTQIHIYFKEYMEWIIQEWHNISLTRQQESVYMDCFELSQRILEGDGIEAEYFTALYLEDFLFSTAHSFSRARMVSPLCQPSFCFWSPLGQWVTPSFFYNPLL